MIPRILEPEVMDTAAEAVDYNAMDHAQVNRAFVDDLLAAMCEKHRQSVDPGRSPNVPRPSATVRVLDLGTGTALIPIELCRRPGKWRITAVDLAREMLVVAAQNVAAARLADRISLERHDAKGLPFADASFDVVMSNSIIHHIPNPRPCLAEMVRNVSDDGLLFVRDLLRPASQPELEQLVRTYAGDANDHQRRMFQESLHAALTLDEIRSLAVGFDIQADCVQQTSDRHWSLVWRRSFVRPA